MSSTVVEARSLSSLTALAANPPSYPRNPTHVKHEPLVLYIARVPGSKDVFLSPMKPREKVVTAEDITSSLYFVHVEHPEDANLVNPEFQDPDYMQQRSNTPNRLSTPIIQRKAVPGTPTAAPTRKAVAGALAPIENIDSWQNANAGQHAQRPGILSPSFEPRGSYDSTRLQTENNLPGTQPRRPDVSVTPAGVSLTLIRRDPASGVQWNVARIDDPTITDITSPRLTEAAARRKPGAPMYIEITNPGYSKFLHSDLDQRPSFPTRTSDLSVRSFQSSNATQGLSSDWSPEPSSKVDNVFRRRLWMEGSHLGGGFGHRKSGSYDRGSSRPNSRGNYNDPSSAEPLPSPSFLTRDDQAYGTLQVTERPSGFRGYVFTSPWNGRCEFVTGASGGTLKCRHVIPGLQGAPPAAATVSEMRFNLPSAAKAPSPKEETSKRSSFFKRGRHSRNNSSISVSRDDGVEDARSSLDRMDLSLGQEFAGGGFGGKQAKLGKIILEDEGLKMMDILVAANIGLWWRAYEKAQAAARAV